MHKIIMLFNVFPNFNSIKLRKFFLPFILWLNKLFSIPVKKESSLTSIGLEILANRAKDSFMASLANDEEIDEATRLVFDSINSPYMKHNSDIIATLLIAPANDKIKMLACLIFALKKGEQDFKQSMKIFGPLFQN